MSSLQIGRLLVGPPTKWNEQVGDPVTNLGGAVVPMVRTALRHAVSLPTLAADGATDTLAARLDIRRALRSMLNNTELKLRGYLYVQYSDDPDQNGWYIPDQGQFADGEGSSGLATGWWVLDNVNWAHVGHLRTNREARNVWLKDLRTGLSPRDTLELILSTDFAALPAVATTIFPNGSTRPINTLTAAVVTASALPTGRDGGACSLATGLSDLTCVAYDRSEAAMNLSDVIVYDRRGQITAPATGPDTSWREAYGPDYPWNWLTGGQPNDTPVLDNGLCRVRYDASVGNPGFRVDVWNGAAYIEQGKVTVSRIGDTNTACDTYVSASLYLDNGYTPDRAVVSVVLASSGDTLSRERVFITMQRGIAGCTFEVYPAPKAAGTNADATLTWTAAVADTNVSALKVDSQSQPPPAGNGKTTATAGTGSSSLGANAALGNATFASSENYVAILRCSAVQTLTAYQANLAVLQSASGAVTSGTDTTGYGVARNSILISSSGAAGYASLDIAFSPTVADQVMEAESMTLGTGTSSTGDGAASNALAATAVRTTDANPHVSKATWPNSQQGVYRVFARMKVSANSASIFAKTGATTGTTRTGINSVTYVWVDLGDITANATTLEIHAWMSGGAGTVSVDRIEAYLLTERVSPARYSGARDLGQTALYDARQLGAVVAR